VKEIKKGALDEGATGVIERAAYGLQDRAGGVSPDDKAQYEDGTDFNDDEGHQPLREQFSIDAAGPPGTSATASGRAEGDVQRARPFPLIFPGVTLGTDKTFSNAALTFAGSVLTITLEPHGGGTFPAKTSISATALEVVAWELQASDTVLKLQFRPDIVTQWSASGPSVVTSYFVAAGGTVDPVNRNRIFNPGSISRNIWGSMARRLARGDSVTLAGVAGFETHLLTCLTAQAFGGDEYTGAPPDHDPAVPLTNGPQGPQIPDFYSTQAERLAMDTATLEIRDPDLVAYVIANPTPSGVTISVDNAAVLPPVANGYEVEVRHQIPAQSVDGVVAPTYFDPANGIIKISTSGMDAGPGHCFEVRRKDGAGEAAHVYDRTPTSPASLLTNLRTAARQLEAFYTGNFLTPVKLEMKNLPAGTYGDADVFWFINGQDTYTRENAVFTMGDGSRTIEWWVTQTAGSPEEGLYIDDDGFHHVYASFQTFVLDDHALGRLTPDIIVEAIVDFLLHDSVEEYSDYDYDYSRDPRLIEPVRSELVDFPVRIAAYAVEGLTGTPPYKIEEIEFLGFSEAFTIEDANREKWNTAMIGDIARAAVSVEPGKTIIFAVLSEKTDTDIFQVKDINELTHSYLGPVWGATYVLTGGGEISHANVIRQQGYDLTYTSAEMRYFGIEIDPDIVETAANTPHIYFNSSGGGHAPPLV